jgi:signal transduction histidine kinase
MQVATSRPIQDLDLLTDWTLTLDRLGEIHYGPCGRALDQPPAELPEQARSGVGALVSRISLGVADYGLVPLGDLAAIARAIPASGDRPMSIAVQVRPTDLLEGQISARAVGRLSQALRDPVSKLALFANLVTHGPADRRSYYEATLSAEIASLARLIDQLSRLAGLMSPAQGPLTSVTLDQLADLIRGELGFDAGDAEPPPVTFDAPDRSVRVDGRLVGEALQHIVAALPHAHPACQQVQVHLTVDNEWVVITLRAPALVISSDHLAERFEPFFDGTMDLGPVLARTIVSRHDGFITVKEGGAGGVMSLWLASEDLGG